MTPARSIPAAWIRLRRDVGPGTRLSGPTTPLDSTLQRSILALAARSGAGEKVRTTSTPARLSPLVRPVRVGVELGVVKEEADALVVGIGCAAGRRVGRSGAGTSRRAERWGAHVRRTPKPSRERHALPAARGRRARGPRRRSHAVKTSGFHRRGSGGAHGNRRESASAPAPPDGARSATPEDSRRRRAARKSEP